MNGKLTVSYRVQILLILTAALLLLAPKADAATASVELGLVNIERGISTPNQGDGQNTPDHIEGRDCRKIDQQGNPPSHCMYFVIDKEAIRPPRHPVYVTVEYYDVGFGLFTIEYDSNDTSAPNDGAVKEGPVELLLDSRKWRKVVFTLSDARFKGKQAHDADFRISCNQPLAVASVTVDTTPPADLEKDQTPIKERISASIGAITPAGGMEVVLGGLDSPVLKDRSAALARLETLAPLFKALGATSIQTSVTWAMLEPQRGKWDFSPCEQVLTILNTNGLKWSPLLVLGPGYATPEWFKRSNESVPEVCIEHGKASQVQSIWNPQLAPRVEEFIKQFSSEYAGKEGIASVLIGISGDLGEATYPTGTSNSLKAAVQEYHSHSGFWCGDKFAREDLRKFLEGKYGYIETLNSAWKTSYKSFSDISPFIIETKPSDRAWLDFLEWYRGRMTRWAKLWLDDMRVKMPGIKVYLCTSGDGRPAQGTDFAAQCQAAAKADCGVRYTSEASSYELNFAATRLLASAARHYGTFFTFEPAGNVSEKGMAARIYNATTSGAVGMFDLYTNCMLQPTGVSAWRDSCKWLTASRPTLPVAVLYPNTSQNLEWGGFYDKAVRLRDVVDFGLVDETMLRDGALSDYDVLILIHGNILEAYDLKIIEDWVKTGGVLLSCNFGEIRTVEGDTSAFKRLFDTGEKAGERFRDIGKGMTMYIPLGWDSDELCGKFASTLASLGTRVGRSVLIDGAADKVYMTDLGNRLLVLNTSDSPVEREVKTAVATKTKVKLPVGISEIPTPKQEQETK